RRRRCVTTLPGALSSFFSSRRRHTRSKRDWSSDVCSSDLGEGNFGTLFPSPSQLGIIGRICLSNFLTAWTHTSSGAHFLSDCVRSEERRVGKECRSRRSPHGREQGPNKGNRQRSR